MSVVLAVSLTLNVVFGSLIIASIIKLVKDNKKKSLVASKFRSN